MSEENKNEQLDVFLTEIGDAIREAKGTTGLINARNMAGIVRGMSGGENLTTELSEYDELNSELEDVIGSLPDAVVPSGTKTITENGTYDVASYASATVNVTSGSGGQDMLQARVDATNSCKYLFYLFQGTSVDFIKNLDTSKVTTMYSMFSECRNLESIPQLDTSSVTDMYQMFSNCKNLESIPQLDTSNITNMTYMFNGCTKLTTIPKLDTSNVTNMYSTFKYCSSLTSIPQLDTSNVTGMSNMFSNCSTLTTIPQLDTSSVTDMSSIFKGCTNLKSILMTGMRVSFDISASTKFERTDLVTILNNLATVTSSTTLTMGSTNLAKLTSSDKAIATNKGWTLA